jgi:hypothetical protein
MKEVGVDTNRRNTLHARVGTPKECAKVATGEERTRGNR